MHTTEAPAAPARLRGAVYWPNMIFLSVIHLGAVAAVVYLAAVQFSWWTIGLGLLWMTLCGLSMTGGYHRLFAHSSYEARLPMRLLYLLFGAASLQNSALRWSEDHRTHHAHTDGDLDPYNATRGFWWSHMGWVVFDNPLQTRRSSVCDLAADPWLAWQHRQYVWIAIVVGALIPAALGMLWGDPIGAVLVVGFLRVAIQWQTTFSVNSFTHLWGKRPFSERTSARDSFWFALITLGEGYHNYHHRFPADYRNGVRWYHFDPTKWWVWTWSKLGQTRRLQRVSRDRIRAAREAVSKGLRAARNEPHEPEVLSKNP